MLARAFFLIFLALAGAGRTALPATPAGTYLQRFLVAFDQGDLAADPTWGQWYAVYGPLRYQRVATAQPYDLRVWTRSDVTHTWVSVRVMLDPEAPHLMRDIRIGTGLRPPGAGLGPPLPLEKALAEIDGYFRRLADCDAFSGAVLVAKDGAPRYQKAFGYSSKRYHVPNDLDTKFDIASLTKLITAVAIAQLADTGKVHFDDPLQRFLPDYPSTATIHQLLTHTAGLGRSRFSSEAFTDRFPHSVQEQLAMTRHAQAFAPGTSVRYSNEGYLVLGAIVEKASGENYYDYVRRHIYEPARMTSSGAYEADREVPDLATGYTFWRQREDGTLVFEPGERRNTTFMMALRGNPAGGTYSTVGDLNRLVKAIENCKLVRCATRDVMLRAQVARPRLPWADLQEGYGYGVETKTIDGIELVGKSGDLAGASAQLEIDRRDGYTIIVLSNYDSIAQPAAEWVTETLLRTGRR